MDISLYIYAICGPRPKRTESAVAAAAVACSDAHLANSHAGCKLASPGERHAKVKVCIAGNMPYGCLRDDVPTTHKRKRLCGADNELVSIH